jgi:hypothetical protein
LLFGQIDRNDLVILASRVECVRRNQNLSAPQPATCIRNEISNRPTPVIEVKLFSLADVSVAGAQFIAPEISS